MRLLVQNLGVMFLDEGHAAAGRAHHVVIVLEKFLHVAGQRGRVLLKAAVGHGLAAAGLSERVVHVHSERAQQLEGGCAHLRVDGIDKAGNEKSYFHNKMLLCVCFQYAKMYTTIPVMTT